jgi:hypothetical protein
LAATLAEMLRPRADMPVPSLKRQLDVFNFDRRFEPPMSALGGRKGTVPKRLPVVLAHQSDMLILGRLLTVSPALISEMMVQKARLLEDSEL